MASITKHRASKTVGEPPIRLPPAGNALGAPPAKPPLAGLCTPAGGCKGGSARRSAGRRSAG
eukprot:CAMPEP_0198539452 /NCGR_PEP_ID=MMETSP1462-20131121/48972_1 /TAXON_ID=1333877 /ORGANISM="Brandtodinium nutriculum, Strain RCC3387" /LENGTH=61 /DNA_ID=CAMNT_0044269507 /DNA_START=34 /DNA_END=216 /DNA_ORIENTATION=+